MKEGGGETNFYPIIVFEMFYLFFLILASHSFLFLLCGAPIFPHLAIYPPIRLTYARMTTATATIPMIGAIVKNVAA